MVSKKETAAANKAVTLAGLGVGSNSGTYNDETVLVKSPSEPLSLKELGSFETHSGTAMHSIQEPAEAMKCSDTISEHTMQEKNIEEHPKNENTGFKQHREMTAQVLEIEPANKLSATVNDDENGDEVYNDVTVVKQQPQDTEPSPSPVPGDPSTITTQEEHQVIVHQTPDEPMQNSTSSIKAQNSQSTVGNVVTRSSPVPFKRNPPQQSPVPRPRPKNRSLSSPAPPKQDLASHIETKIDTHNTKPTDQHLSGTKKDRPSIPPKPSLRQQSSSPLPTDKKETETPSPRAAQKTTLPTIPPRPMYASQKNTDPWPGNASSAENSPNVSTLRKQFEPS